MEAETEGKGMEARRKMTVHPIAVINRNIFHIWVASAWIGIVKYFGWQLTCSFKNYVYDISNKTI